MDGGDKHPPTALPLTGRLLFYFALKPFWHSNVKVWAQRSWGNLVNLLLCFHIYTLITNREMGDNRIFAHQKFREKYVRGSSVAVDLSWRQVPLVRAQNSGGVSSDWGGSSFWAPEQWLDSILDSILTAVVKCDSWLVVGVISKTVA